LKHKYQKLIQNGKTLQICATLQNRSLSITPKLICNLDHVLFLLVIKYQGSAK